MARYEITSAPLAAASDRLDSLAGGLTAAQEQLGDILPNLSENMHAIRRQVAAERDNIGNLLSYADILGRTLQNIVEIYAKAERLTFGDNDKADPKQQQPPTQQHPLPITRKTYGVTLSSAIIMPDWLQAAVVKYIGRC